MMQAAGVTGAEIHASTCWWWWWRSLYSVYALYASGKDAVMGGMLVMGLGWLIWTFLAPRFMSMQPAAIQRT